MDIGITDAPYADAINYHEITEYFIAWLRKNPPPPLDHFSTRSVWPATGADRAGIAGAESSSKFPSSLARA
jgi:hypothetical protein